MAALREVEVYLEVGEKRVFAGAVDWPGWNRSGKTEEAALETLAEYGPRYADAVRAGGLRPPARGADFRVVERLKGDATTDFGAPGAAPEADRRPVSAADLTRLKKCLDSAWAAFDRAARDARGAELATGPRGGGRQGDAIVEHVVGAEGGYLRRLAAGRRAIESQGADRAVTPRTIAMTASTSTASCCAGITTCCSTAVYKSVVAAIAPTTPNAIEVARGRAT